ncbi:MAG: hypothetical protein BAJALOKI1v1_660010 [Promethearchaeota archaeon]|nr:MAG: hypothetical protein BAJALOKI1v1_660010 [Candidatus Lokiarchaeota archaeon]
MVIMRVEVGKKSFPFVIETLSDFRKRRIGVIDISFLAHLSKNGILHALVNQEFHGLLETVNRVSNFLVFPLGEF